MSWNGWTDSSPPVPPARGPGRQRVRRDPGVGIEQRQAGTGRSVRTDGAGPRLAEPARLGPGANPPSHHRRRRPRRWRRLDSSSTTMTSCGAGSRPLHGGEQGRQVGGLVARRDDQRDLDAGGGASHGRRQGPHAAEQPRAPASGPMAATARITTPPGGRPARPRSRPCPSRPPVVGHGAAAADNMTLKLTTPATWLGSSPEPRRVVRAWGRRRTDWSRGCR